MSKRILEMKGITKVFPGVKALDNVDLSLDEGEVLALVGENGAGKSTLLKILSGIYTADEGEIIIGGKKMRSLDIRQAHGLGIGIIHQELNYFPDLTVAENIYAGAVPVTKFGRVNWKQLNKMADAEMSRLGLDIPVKARMCDLSVAEQQLVEIIKALSKEIKILIMDEPTSALNDEEATKLLEFVRELAQKGTSIIYISHRLEEIFKIADRVTVLRDGKNITSFSIEEADYDRLITAMVGREIEDMYPKSAVEPKEIVLQVEGLSTKAVRDISLDIRSGEVVGVFGLLGSGRTEMAKAIFGLEKHLSGSIRICGKETVVRTPGEAIKHGIAYVPSERKKEGLVLMESVTENIMLASFRQFTAGLYLEWRNAKKASQEWTKKLDIRTPSIDASVENLSGGNQQKVVISKWLQTNPKVLILNEPTRGIDVGAKVEIYRIIDELCHNGLGILLISSELSELLALADRFIVMHEGTISGRVEKENATQEVLMNYAVGRQ